MRKGDVMGLFSDIGMPLTQLGGQSHGGIHASPRNEPLCEGG